MINNKSTSRICILDLSDDKCQMRIEIYQTEKERSKVSKFLFSTAVGGDPMAPLSYSCLPEGRGGRHSFPWISPLTLAHILKY